MSKYIGIAPELLKNGISDSDTSLNLRDIERQMSSFRAQGMLKTELPIDVLVDRRYVTVAEGGEASGGIAANRTGQR